LELDSKDGAINLVKGLSGSRFFDYAVMIMLQNNLDYENEAELRDIYNYYLFINELEDHIFDYYRKKSLVAESDKEYKKEYYSKCIDFWQTLSWENNIPVFYEEGFEDELFKRFGTKTFTGEGGDQIGFFAGHSVINDKRIIEHYGRQTKLLSCL